MGAPHARTFTRPLLLAFLLAPLGATAGAGDDAEDAPGQPWSFSDPAGDVSLAEENGAGIPAAAVTGPADIVAVQVADEDELGFHLTILLDRFRYTGDEVPGPASLFFQVVFQIEGSPVEYQVRGRLDGSLRTDGDPLFLASAFDAFASLRMCLPKTFDCLYQPVQWDLDEEVPGPRLWVPKASLMGLEHDYDPGPPPAPLPVPAKGSALGDWRVRVILEVPTWPVEAVDVAPNEGEAPAYALRAAPANAVLQLRVADGSPELPVQPGLNQTVRFSLKNGAATKRVALLEYRLEGPEAALGKYHVTGPSSVTVPPGEARNFTFALDVASSSSASDEVFLRVRATSAGFPNEFGAARPRLVPGALLGPGANTLHFHALGSPHPLGVEPLPCPAFFLGPCTWGFLSPRADDPRGVPEGRIQGYAGLQSDAADQEYWLSMQERLPAPLAFDPDQAVEVDLALESPVQLDGVRVDAQIYYRTLSASPDEAPETVYIFGAQADASIGPQPGRVRLSALPQFPEDPIVPAGARLRFELRVTEPIYGLAGSAAGGVRIVAADSQIRFPLVELPEALRVEAVPSPFQLQLTTDADLYVNPGEARRFNLAILNQGHERERLELAATPNATLAERGWRAEVRPGRTFELDPGDVITVAVLVHAPASAAEGDIAVVRVNATAQSGAISTLTVTAIAVGLDMPDESSDEAWDEDAREKLVGPSKRSTPGFEIALVLAAATLLGLRRRRS